MVGMENVTANDVPAESLSQPQIEEPKMYPIKVERYFSLLIQVNPLLIQVNPLSGIPSECTKYFELSVVPDKQIVMSP